MLRHYRQAVGFAYYGLYFVISALGLSSVLSITRYLYSILGVIPGLFVPLHFRSRERKDHRELSLPWNFRSMEHSLLGTFAPVELSFLRSESSKNFRSVEHSLPWNFRSSGANVPRTFVPMKLSYHDNEYQELSLQMS